MLVLIRKSAADDKKVELYKAEYDYEGCLKRKVLLKNGKKPSVGLEKMIFLSNDDADSYVP